jgi:hypothetical protein
MNNALPSAAIVHAISGRARLRIAERRGDGVFFASIATGLSAIPGVFHVDVRPLTGSVLIQHGAPLARIGAAAEQSRLFVLANGHPPAAPDPAISIDPQIVLAVGLGAFALWQLAQGRILPPAITLGWYAAGLAGLLMKGSFADGGE